MTFLISFKNYNYFLNKIKINLKISPHHFFNEKVKNFDQKMRNKIIHRDAGFDNKCP